MESYKRFNDENYKHWLQAAESLYILRNNIRDFVENETETFHKSLREQLKDFSGECKCSLAKCPPKAKTLPICGKCQRWKDEIINNHNNKGSDIHWNNCQPNLWPKDKWEVAKVYMIRGIKNHRSFDQFDITSILNFMSNCKHFMGFTNRQYLTKVISVRNKVMHSPDFSLSKEDIDKSLKDILELAKSLENHSPRLKDISIQIQKFKSILKKWSEQSTESQNTSDSRNERLELLDREQKALREKLQFLAQCYEDSQGTDLKVQEELQGMKNFLEENKDLLESLGPQLEQLDEIKEQVNKHEQDIGHLNKRVNRLETVAPDPMFSSDELKFKNHLLEEARGRNIPVSEIEFTEEREASGYRGSVNVNGRTFRGLHVCKNKVKAHQEVAKIALDYMNSHPEWKEEATTSLSSSTSTPSIVHYGTVTVVLKNQEVVSDSCVHEGEAIESAYRKLAGQFGLTSPEGKNFKTAVLEHFQTCTFPTPSELPVCQGDKKLCKLQLSGPFTFYDKDGASKKKQAEHQAAKAALQNLSEILQCRSLDNADDNWKGFLKERLDAHGLQNPQYDFRIKKLCISQDVEEVSTTDVSSQISMAVQDLPTASTINAEDCQKTVALDSSPPQTLCQPSKMDSAEHTEHTGTIDESQVPKTLDSIPSETSSQAPKVDSADIWFYGIVTVVLDNQEVISDGCVSQEAAIDSAYRELACKFRLMSLKGKTAVREHFQRCNFPLPLEIQHCQDNKFFCKLQLIGAFTFFDKDGFSNKKQAYELAAKVALKHLSGLFECSFEIKSGKNYKMVLKEQLDALHLKSPVYTCREKGVVGEEMEAPGTSGDSSHSTAISQKVGLPPKISFSQECVLTDPQDAGLNITNISPNMDNTAIDSLLALFHLKPPSVTVESFKTEKIFSCSVNIHLEKFTFQNNNDYTNKKEAFRKTYLLFGNALGFSSTTLDENNAAMLVKQHYSQKSLTLPKEVFEDKKCSINDITYSLSYDGEGSTEMESKHNALHKALDTLNLLAGFSTLPKCNTVEDTERQINFLLKTKGQKDFIYSPKPNLYKSSAELLFKDYTMESQHKTKKKDNVHHLSICILGLLAVDADPNTVSLRNCLDDWFKQRNLKQPVFENTKEVNGSKVTFSVKVSCSSPEREDSVKVAEENLCAELKKRLEYLTYK